MAIDYIPGTVPIGASIAPISDRETYQTHWALWAKGGLRTVFDYIERDEIPTERRESGMLVFLRDDRTTWRLREDLITWEPGETGGSAMLLEWATHDLDDWAIEDLDGVLILEPGEEYYPFVTRTGDRMQGPLMASRDPVVGTDDPQQVPGYQWVLDQVSLLDTEMVVEGDRMVGRLDAADGAVEFLAAKEVFDWVRYAPGALSDTDSTALADIDGRPLFGPTDVFSNPPIGTRIVATVDEMMAMEWPWLIDRVLVLGDPITEWVMVGGYHGLVPDDEKIVAHESGYGVFVLNPGSSGGGQFFLHEQPIPTETWIINHDGGRYAAGVFVMDLDGVELRARITQPVPDQVIVFHETAQAGKAILTI